MPSDAQHLEEIDQTETGQRSPVGSARAKERACQTAVMQWQRTGAREDARAVLSAHEEWAVMVGAPSIELRGPISADDLRDAVEAQKNPAGCGV